MHSKPDECPNQSVVADHWHVPGYRQFYRTKKTLDNKDFWVYIRLN